MMKKIYLALMCMAAVTMFTACGGGSKKSADGTAETRTETKAVAKASNLDVGDRYAFAGLASADVVPPFAREISDVKDNHTKLPSATTFFGFGKDRAPFSEKEYNDYAQKLFGKIKSIAENGKVYREGALGQLAKGEEVTELGKMILLSNESEIFSFIYKYDERWYGLDMRFRKSFDGKTEGTFCINVSCKTFLDNLIPED